MKSIKEELERRRLERRSKSSFTWTGLIIKILAFIFVIMVIRFFADPEAEKFRDFFFKSKPKIEINEGAK